MSNYGAANYVWLSSAFTKGKIHLSECILIQSLRRWNHQWDTCDLLSVPGWSIAKRDKPHRLLAKDSEIDGTTEWPVFRQGGISTAQLLIFSWHHRQQ